MTTVLRSGSFVEFHVENACVHEVNLAADVKTHQELDVVVRELEQKHWFAGEIRERFMVICLSYLNVY